MVTKKSDLPLRIIMADPVPGVAIALQHGAAAKATLVGPVEASAAALAFELEIAVAGSLAGRGSSALSSSDRPAPASSI